MKWSRAKGIYPSQFKAGPYIGALMWPVTKTREQATWEVVPGFGMVGCKAMGTATTNAKAKKAAEGWVSNELKKSLKALESPVWGKCHLKWRPQLEVDGYTARIEGPKANGQFWWRIAAYEEFMYHLLQADMCATEELAKAAAVDWIKAELTKALESMKKK